MSQSTEIPESKATIEDYEAVAKDFQIIEFIAGDILVTPPPSIEHQRMSRELMLTIGQDLQNKKAGELFAAPTGLRTASGEVLEPDLQIILKERKNIINTNYIKGSPHIIIEILSPGTQHRDWGIKKDIYEEIGVNEYWIIEPKIQEVTIFKLEKGKLKRKQKLNLKKGEKITSQLLPDFSFSL
ncbi:MAG: hypothetical protein GF308_08455 [Candidatus Heimdallarchaeota archaeon]|nr:hypothetical protein [Candidatus Heimdallarchaeota archaeon]